MGVAYSNIFIDIRIVKVRYKIGIYATNIHMTSEALIVFIVVFLILRALSDVAECYRFFNL